MFKRLFIAVIICCFSVGAYAQTIDINLSEDSAQIMLKLLISEEIFDYSEFNTMFLYTTDSQLGSVGFDVYGELEFVPNLELGAGAKFYGGNADGSDVMSLGLGIALRYTPPTLAGLVLSGTLYYSPEVVAFLDADRLFEASFRVGYQIIPKATVYIGYRNIWTDIENGEKVTFDEGIHGGLEFRF